MIGITGGIASGKSTVAERLRNLGAIVLDADQIARDVVEINTPGWIRVKEQFPEVIQADGAIDRKKLGQIVFSDPSQRELLEGIIHPLVHKTFMEEMKKHKGEGALVFAEVPLLYEVGWDSWLHPVWVVYVDYEIQLKRLMARAGISQKEAKKMIASQMPLQEKCKKAQYIIDNTGSLADTYAQVDALWKEFRLENSVDSP